MQDFANYDIVNEVFELNSHNLYLSKIDPFDYNTRNGTLYMPDFNKYPTQYHLKEIQWQHEYDREKFITLKIYMNPEFDLKISIENLYYVLEKIKKQKIWSEQYATLLIEKLNEGQNYIDFYNLVLNEKLSSKLRPNNWSDDEYKKYVLEYENNNILNTSSSFKNVIITTACKEGLISIFDRHLKCFSKYLVYQGTGMMFDLCGSCGISFYYRQQELCYYMQVQS